MTFITHSTFNYLLIAWLAVGLIAFVYLFFQTAPYGKHASEGWGPEISAKAGWIIEECPAFFLMLIFFFLAGDYTNPLHVIFTVLYCGHYFNRSFIWPMRAQSTDKKMPLMVVFSAIGFNFVNVFFQGTWIFLLSDYSSGWLVTTPFLLGLLIFLSGFYINVRSDEIMINLRKEKGEGYHIPEGFLFNKVSNPNYLGEFIEWLGWAIMTFSWAGLVFFLWTVCNLFPRAISNHKWYQEKFEDYPKDRKAVIPNII